MKISEARQVVAQIPAEHHEVLSAAHARYMHFTGVHRGDVEETVVLADRETFAHLLKFAEDGMPSLSDDRCAAFMAAVTSLPVQWCLAWDEVEFCNEHGDDFFEAQRKLQASKAIEARIG